MMLNPTWLQKNLLNWFATNGRQDLPWKTPLDPYRVWLSEIMLQQTQVATVIDYFNRFIKVFPTLDKLAKAPIDAVLAQWAGLGYYARARNLHKSAQILSQMKTFPQSVEELVALPGIGRSTAGAILAQSFNIKAPILDGNVKRVLCRLHRIQGYPEQKDVLNLLWEIAEKYTPKNKVADYTQAIMDLGATCCTRTMPLCDKCPLQKKCEAYNANEQHLYPHKKPSKRIPTKHLYMLCLFNKKGEILLEKRPQKGIWGGLFSLPEFLNKELVHTYLQENFALKARLSSLPSFKHTFTHYHLTISPLKVTSESAKLKCLDHQHWQTLVDLDKIGLPAPIKKLLSNPF